MNNKIVYAIALIISIPLFGCEDYINDSNGDIDSFYEPSYIDCYSGGASILKGTTEGSVISDDNGGYIFNSQNIQISSDGVWITVPQESIVKTNAECAIYTAEEVIIP